MRHPPEALIHLLFYSRIYLPGLFRGANVIGPFIFGVGGTDEKSGLLQFRHRFGNDAFIQGEPFCDLVLGQAAKIAYDQNHHRLGGRKMILRAAAVEPDM